MPVFRLTDADDPRLAPYVSIRERDLTGGHGGRFIAEGKVTLETLLRRSRFAVESLFLCETRLAPLADLLAREQLTESARKQAEAAAVRAELAAVEKRAAEEQARVVALKAQLSGLTGQAHPSSPPPA